MDFVAELLYKYPDEKGKNFRNLSGTPEKISRTNSEGLPFDFLIDPGAILVHLFNSFLVYYCVIKLDSAGRLADHTKNISQIYRIQL